ncbi:cysteine protease [Microbotryomycetes sp. JL201]|nr:cysteine protease [Microbotryomycetes sp. JL201]
MLFEHSWTAQWAAKLREAQTLGTRATRLELGRNYNEAFQLYVKAAQSYMYLVRHSTDSHEKEKLRQVSAKLVERATRIKHSKQDALKPVAQRKLDPVEEQDAVLERASLINGHRYHRWRDAFEQGMAERLTANAYRNRESARERPPMSAAQTERKRRYQSLAEVLPGACMIKPNVSGRQVVQDNVSDCSLVSALIIGAEHHAKFGSRVRKPDFTWKFALTIKYSQLAFSCLFPKDEQALPRISPTNDYVAKLLVNGTWRAVSMDDWVPVSTDRVPMCAMTEDRDQLWPSLVEKAYLKVMGGYEFSGSALSGWIPEHMSLRSGFRSEKTWDRIRDGFESGACVLTLGTPKEIFSTPLMLSALHSYAVLDLREDGAGRRPVEIMNPWRQLGDAAGWEADVADNLPGPRGSGTFLLEWDDLSRHFEALHVSWNPSLFPHEASIHCCVERKPKSPSKRTNAQFVLQLSETESKSQNVWLLLSRHIISKDDPCVFMSLNVAAQMQGLGGGNVRHETSTFQDNEHLLYRFHSDASATAFDVFVSSQSDGIDFAFTLRAFSTCPVAFAEGLPALPYSSQLEGRWDGRTAGGNHSCPTFLNNPQYSLRVLADSSKPSARAQVDLGVHPASGIALSVNVRLVRGGGRRVGDIEQRDVIAGTSEYSYGSDHATVSDLAPGTYTVIASSFDARTRGDFVLNCESSMPIEVKPIPQEGDGMYVRSVSSAWNDGSARVSLHLDRPTSLSMRLRAKETPVPVAVIVADTASTRIAQQTPMSALVCGLLTNIMTLSPTEQGYTINLSTGQRDCHDEFELFVYADKPVTIKLQQ